MAQFADEESYEEMIRVLVEFKNQTEENCQTMMSAGKDCVDNTDGDPAAVKCDAKMNECLNRIRATFETVNQVIAALQEEIERIRAAAQKADSAQ